jgi:hypothetical protein
MSNKVVIVIGAGGMGQVIARRQGTGRQALLADFSETDRGQAGPVTGVIPAATSSTTYIRASARSK